MGVRRETFAPSRENTAPALLKDAEEPYPITFFGIALTLMAVSAQKKI